MNISEGYDHLVRARGDLWATLEGVPDEVLSRQLLNGAKLHCIKDLVFHVASVEDFWIREEILREQPLRSTIPALKDTPGGPIFAGFALKTLLDYWRVVEQGTLTYLPTLTDDELKRVVTVHDRPGKRYTVDIQVRMPSAKGMRNRTQSRRLVSPSLRLAVSHAVPIR